MPSKAGLAGVLVDFRAIDLKTFAEPDISPIDKFLEQYLALEQAQLPQVVAVEIEQIEGDHHDLSRPTFEFVLQHGEVGCSVIGRHHYLAVDDRPIRR